MEPSTYTVSVGDLATYDVGFAPGVLSAFGAFLLSLGLMWIFRKHILYALKKLAEKTSSDVDDLLVELVERIPWTFYTLISIFIGLQFVDAPKFLADVVGYSVIFVIVYYLIRASYIFIDFSRDHVIKRRQRLNPSEDVSLIRLIASIIKYSMWIVGALLVLSNMDVDISALLAGMGVGGLAIALAAQHVLEDIFASFSIFFDKPYKIGDFLVVGEDVGVVKKIGIKTTRIDTLRGEELVVSNREMTTVRVHNFGRMPHRRIEFKFGITYETPVDKVKMIPDIMKSIVESHDLVRFDRAHFKRFGDFSLDFEVIYYLESADYTRYMDTQQSINLKVMEAFQTEKIDFAYPTQLIYTKK